MAKILLVEDNEENLDMLMRRLQRRGFEVITAVNGQQAIDKAASDHPDLILMDMNMPLIDGWEASRRIKAAPESHHVPIIALTAHAMTGDRAKALEAGCDDYHTKPVELPKLLAQIEAVLKREAPG